jgi:hypothetical protein
MGTPSDDARANPRDSSDIVSRGRRPRSPISEGVRLAARETA